MRKDQTMKRKRPGRADHCDPEGTRGWREQPICAEARDKRGELLPGRSRRARSLRGQASEGAESKNVRLKKLLADAMLDNAALKDLLAKKW